MCKVLITGGREYADRKFLYEYLDNFHKTRPITLLIHGAARGADKLADDWALINNIPRKPFPADWKTYPKAAGPIRNSQMLKETPDLDFVIAFPGNEGTKDMITKAAKKNVPVLIAKE